MQAEKNTKKTQIGKAQKSTNVLKLLQDFSQQLYRLFEAFLQETVSFAEKLRKPEYWKDQKKESKKTWQQLKLAIVDLWKWVKEHPFVQNFLKWWNDLTKQQQIALSASTAGILLLLFFSPTLVRWIKELEYSLRPEVTESSIFNNTEDIDLDESISLTFSKPIWSRNLEKKLREEVDNQIVVEGTDNWRVLKITRSGGWEPDQVYNLTLSDKNLIKYGYSLSFATIKTPQVALTNLKSSVVDPDHRFLFGFSQEVFEEADKETASDFLTFDPGVEGEAEILSPSVLSFTPSEEMERGKEYRLRINAQNIVNEKGLEMKNDFSESFNVLKEEEGKSERDYYRFIGAIYADVYQDSSDPITLVLYPDVSKESFEQSYKITNRKGEELETSIGWETKQLSELSDSYGFSSSYYFSESESTAFLLARITPKFEWKGDEYYTFKIEGDLKDSSGRSMPECDSYSNSFECKENKIKVITPFKVTSTSVSLSEDEKLYVAPNAESSFTIYFNNYPFVDEEELASLVKLFSLSENNKEVEVEADSQKTTEREGDIDVSAKYEVGKQYKIWVSGDLQDEFGQRLGEPFEVTFEAVESESTESITPILNIYGNERAYVDNYGEHRILLESRALNNIRVEVAKLTPEEFIKIDNLQNGNGYDYYNSEYDSEKDSKTKASFERGEVVKSWTKQFENFDNEEVKSEVLEFQYQIEGLENGIYVVRAADGEDKYRDYRFLFVSQNVVLIKESERTNDVLVWVANSYSGEPLVGKDIILLSGQREHKARTDEKGVATFDNIVGDFHVYSEQGDVYASSDQNYGLSKYRFLDYSSIYDKDSNNGKFTHFVYFDKPLYRVDQDVHFKIFTRARDGNGLKVPHTDIAIKVENLQNETIFSQVLTPNEFGTVNSSFHLDNNLQSGLYNMLVGDTSIGSFRVEDYQVHNFYFQTDIDEKKIYSPDESVNIGIDANYYFGQPLKDAEVEVSLYVRNVYGGHPGESDEELWEYTFPSLYTYEASGDLTYFSSLKVGETRTKTDENGKAHVSVSLNIPEKIQFGLTKTLSIEVKVANSLGEEEYQTLYKQVGPKGGVIGIGNDDYYVYQGQSFDADIVTLDESLNRAPNWLVKAEFFRLQDHEIKRRRANGTYYWETSTEEILESTDYVWTDSAGRAHLSYKPLADSEYKVNLSIPNNPKAYNTASFVSYQKESFRYYSTYNEDAKSELTSDKEEYSVGDTAHFTPELPNNRFVALVTTERDEVIDYELVNLEQTNTLSRQVTEELQPNFYYSFFAFSPHSFDNQYIDYKMGIAEVKVSLSAKSIDLEMSTDKEKYSPQDEVTLLIKNNKGEAEYLVAVIDKAVLDLSKIDHNEDLAERLLGTLWASWPLSVSTSSNLTVYENKKIAEMEWKNKGGSGDSAANLLQLQEEDIRKEFKEVAFWLPAQVSEDGVLEVKFNVPDNLTTWEIVAIAITKDTHIGAQTKEIIVSKDVSIISGIPSYLTKGDEVDLVYGANFDKDFAQQNVDSLFKAQVTAENGEILCKEEFTKGCSRDAKISEFPIFFSFSTVDTGQAELTFSVSKDDKVLDAEKKSFEVKSDTQNQHNTFYGDTRANPDVEYDFVEGHENSEKKVKVILSDSVVGDLSGLKHYFENYSNKCSEQASSQMLALLPYKDEEKITNNIKDGIHHLYTLQNGDGGWGIWQNNKSINFNTLHAYYALKQAQDSGFDVDDQRLKRAEEFIMDNINEMGHEKPFAWSVLADVGKFDINGVNNFYDSQLDEETPLVTKAHIAYVYRKYLDKEKVGIFERRTVQSKIDRLARDLQKEMKMSKGKGYWQENRDFVRYYYNSNIKSTAVILYVLLEVKGDDKSLVPAINYLKDEWAKDYIWDTQANYNIFKALKKARETFSVDLKNADAKVTLNGKEYTDFAEDEGNLVLEVTLPKEKERLDLKVESDKGTLVYFQVEVDYEIPLSYVKAEDEGMSMFTEYTTMNNKRVDKFNLGVVYKVRTTVFVRDDLQQSEIHIPLPGGLRPVNFDLNFTSDVVLEKLNQEESQNRYFENMAINPGEVVFYTGDNYYSTHLDKGIYTFTFYARASYSGSFQTKGPWAQEMYLPGRYTKQESSEVDVVKFE